MRQESANEGNPAQCREGSDLLLLNTVSQKDEKPHTAGLDATATAHVKISITEIPHEKSSIRQCRKP